MEWLIQYGRMDSETVFPYNTHNIHDSNVPPRDLGTYSIILTTRNHGEIGIVLILPWFYGGSYSLHVPTYTVPYVALALEP
jgi:hypothetical protein